jgi:hypothetical protein
MNENNMNSGSFTISLEKVTVSPQNETMHIEGLEISGSRSLTDETMAKLTPQILTMFQKVLDMIQDQTTSMSKSDNLWETNDNN